MQAARAVRKGGGGGFPRFNCGSVVQRPGSNRSSGSRVTGAPSTSSQLAPVESHSRASLALARSSWRGHSTHGGMLRAGVLTAATTPWHHTTGPFHTMSTPLEGPHVYPLVAGRTVSNARRESSSCESAPLGLPVSGGRGGWDGETETSRRRAKRDSPIDSPPIPPPLADQL